MTGFKITVPDAALVRPLTSRESEILRCLAEGLTGTQIARQLHLGESTVKSHTTSLYRRLGALTAAQAVSRGYELGLMRPPDGVCCRRAVADWLGEAAARTAGEVAP